MCVAKRTLACTCKGNFDEIFNLFDLGSVADYAT
jgi:hypothetical protein